MRWIVAALLACVAGGPTSLSWAMRRGIAYEARTDEMALAPSAHRAP